MTAGAHPARCMPLGAVGAPDDEHGRDVSGGDKAKDRHPAAGRPAAAGLLENEARFRVLTEQASDVIAELAADSRILYVSPRFTDLLGYPEAEVLGRPAPELIHPADLESFRASRIRADDEQESLELLCRVRHRDGSWRWMEVVGRPFRTADAETRVVVVCRDVSSRVEVEATRRAQREAEVRIAEVTRRFLALGSGEREIDDAIQESLKAAAEVANVDRCYLISLISAPERAPEVFQWMAEGTPLSLHSLGLPDGDRHAWAVGRLHAGEIIRAPNVWEMPSEAQAIRADLMARGVRSYLAIPVLASERLHAVLGFESPRSERNWSEQEIALLRLVAELCTSALRRQAAEKALREGEERFRTLTENAQDSICEISADGRFLYANPRFSEMTGFSPEEIGALNAYDLIHPEDVEKLEEASRQARRGRQGGRLLYRGRRRDGSWRWFEASGRAYRSASNQVRLAAVVRDVTEGLESRQELERKLKLEERIADLSRHFLELGPDEIDGGILEGLASVGELSQADRGLLLYMDPDRGVVLQAYEWPDEAVASREGNLDLIRASDYPTWLESLLRGEVLHIRGASDLPAGGSREAALMRARGVRSLLGIPLLSGSSLIGVLGFESLREEKSWSDEAIALLRLLGEIFVSALRRKQTEQALQQSRAQLLQAQKMEAVGTLAGGVAHDFNNQLSVILGNARFVAGQVEGNPELTDALTDLQRAGMHCAQLTRSLLAFSRHTPVSPQPIEVEKLVSDVRELLEPLIPASIEFEIQVQNGSECVLADRTQLQQVLVNLAVNARDAMPDGGRLRITTQQRSLDSEGAAGLGLERPGEYVEFAVQDDGMGMDEETASRVFDPFFTTKELGKGTGLGLATAYGILRESKGAISVESQLGRGTTFRALFPHSEAGVQSLPPEGEDSDQKGRETILLVEDEPGVRRLLHRLLSLRGYHVLEAGDGVDALCLSRVHQGPIEALVTDIVMPQMGGRELAARLKEERPGIAVLFLSGYSQEETEVAGEHLLRKPFSEAALLAELRGLLDRA